jgi:hypothetical protein
MQRLVRLFPTQLQSFMLATFNVRFSIAAYVKSVLIMS